jgi:hypothetical protein
MPFLSMRPKSAQRCSGPAGSLRLGTRSYVQIEVTNRAAGVPPTFLDSGSAVHAAKAPSHKTPISGGTSKSSTNLNISSPIDRNPPDITKRRDSFEMATSVNSTTGLPLDYVPGFICHLGTCNIAEWGFVHYQPSMIGNVLFLIIIDLLGAAHLILNPYHHTGLFGICMLLGLSFESSGYIARIMLHFDPFQRGYFLWYLISLTMGPVFIAAAIYLCLGRIVVVYGEEISRIKPRAYTMFFLFCDFIALSIQTVGGAIAASAPITNKPMVQYSLPMFPLIVLLILVAQSWNPHSCRRSFLSSCKFVCILGVRSRISVASV